MKRDDAGDDAVAGCGAGAAARPGPCRSWCRHPCRRRDAEDTCRTTSNDLGDAHEHETGVGLTNDTGRSPGTGPLGGTGPPRTEPRRRASRAPSLPRGTNPTAPQNVDSGPCRLGKMLFYMIKPNLMRQTCGSVECCEPSPSQGCPTAPAGAAGPRRPWPDVPDPKATPDTHPRQWQTCTLPSGLRSVDGTHENK